MRFMTTELRLAAAAAVLGLSFLGTGAQAADPQVWQGDAFITGYANATAQSVCVSGDIASIGDNYRIVYRPIIAGSPANSAKDNEGITFFGSRNAIHYYTDDGTSFAKPGKSYIIYLKTRAESSGQTTPPAAIPFHLTISPTKITLTTQTVTISGTLDDFEDASGCNVTFTAALDRRVD
jgi:hypothetical protein